MSSPNSAGKLRSLLLDISKDLKLIKLPISLGSLKRLLSLRYKAVKCSNCHNIGLTFLTLPIFPLAKKNKTKQKIKYII